MDVIHEINLRAKHEITAWVKELDASLFKRRSADHNPFAQINHAERVAFNNDRLNVQTLAGEAEQRGADFQRPRPFVVKQQRGLQAAAHAVVAAR